MLYQRPNMNTETTNVEIGSNSQGNSPSLATVLNSLSWGGASYPKYEARAEVTADAGAGGGAAASTSSTGAEGGGNAGGGGSSTAGQSGESSTPNAGQGGAAGAEGNEANLRALRQNYETLKPWEKAAQTIKDPNAALQAHTRVTKMFNDGLALAKQLGYTEDSYKAAFEDDPVDTLATLRNEHAKANPNAAEEARLRKIAEDAARKANQPVTEEINRQKTEVALNKLDGEINRLITDDKLGFGKDVSPEVREYLENMLDQMLPDEVLAEVKIHGKVSGVAPIFEQAKAQLIKVINAYNASLSRPNNSANGNGRTFNRPAANGNGNGQPKQVHELTLDDIINDGAVLPGVKAGKY